MSNRILPFALALLAGSLPSIGCKSSNLFTPPAKLDRQADSNKLASTEKTSENVAPQTLANQLTNQDNSTPPPGAFQLSLGDQEERATPAPSGNPSASLPDSLPAEQPASQPDQTVQASTRQISKQFAAANAQPTSLTAESAGLSPTNANTVADPVADNAVKQAANHANEKVDQSASETAASGVTDSLASTAKRTLAAFGLSNPTKNFLSRESLAEELAEFESFPFAFNLPNVAGEQVDSARFGGQLMVIDIWATWCPPCRKAIPEFVALQSEFESHGVQVIGITCDSNNPGDAAETARKAYNIGEKMNVNYPLLVDDGTTRPQIPDFRSFPTTLFVTADGQVRYLAVGVQPQERMTAIIRAILDI